MLYLVLHSWMDSSKNLLSLFIHTEMNVKKMFAASTGVLMLATLVTPAVNGAANYGTELTGAYEYAFSKGITTMTSIDNANMYGELTRGQLAKMISNWAEKELGTKVDATKVCSFTDANTAEGDLAAYLTKSCQMGLMGQGIDAFRPNAKVTRGEFGTTLSRALWGNKYEGATPYYANHLQALKDAGIMTKIENPSQLEIRGYVMLMLQRSSAESIINNVVNSGANNTGSTNGVVKAGDLKISATAATNRRLVDGAVNDLDTIKFEASENITLDRIVLERFGYSNADAISGVWLENAEGQRVTNDRSVNSKDEVVLSFNRDYRTFGKTADLTLVVQVASGSANKTIGFKVKSVESSAKNLDISSYTPFTYDVVKYDGTKVAVTLKGSDRKYNYAEGKLYEVARLQVKPATSNVDVHGFTLVNTGNLDLPRYLDKVEVLADGKAVSNLKFSTNRDDHLVVSFDALSVERGKNVNFVVNASLKNFDKFGEKINLIPVDASSINAVEAKTRSRVTTTEDSFAGKGKTYTFQGSEVRLTNTRLTSTVDAAAGSNDVVVASGRVELSAPIVLKSFDISVDGTGLDTLSINVDGRSIEGKRNDTHTVFTFSNIDIEKSGTIQFVASLDTNATYNRTLSFTPASFDKTRFENAKYDDSRNGVKDNVVGSISFSKLKVQPAKGSLSKSISKDVEFVTRETATKTVFEGTYTAQKQDVILKSFALTGNHALASEENLTLRVLIDGKEVASTDLSNSTATSKEEFFNSDVVVEKGKSVSVKVTAEGYLVKDAAGTPNTYTYNFGLYGEDRDGTTAGNATSSFVAIKKVDSASVTVSDADRANRSNVVLKGSNITLGKFIVKSSNSANEATVNSLNFTLKKDGNAVDFSNDIDSKIELRVNGSAATDLTGNANGLITGFNLNETIDKQVEVEVVAKNTLDAGNYELTFNDVNLKPVTRKVNKKVVDTLVRVVKMENINGDTRYTLAVDKYESDKDASNLKFKYKKADGTVVTTDPRANVSDGETFTLAGDPDYNFTITEVVYDVTGQPTVTIDKATYEDYFSIDGTALKIFRS